MNSKSHKILITVVTRNRPTCLNTFLSLAVNQTLVADEILVVDNDSEPETKQLVNDFKKNYDTVKYLNTGGNLGSAGGQSIALNYAAANHFDLVYTLDDDCEPALNALEEVYKKWVTINDKENTVLSSLSLALNSESEFSFALWAIKNSPFSKNNLQFWTKTDIPKNLVNNDIFWGWSHFFLGVLIPVSVIKKCGSVNPKYFIRGDEFEYFIRLNKLNVRLGTVLNSIVKHPKEMNTSKGSSDLLKQYYTIRNNTEIRLTYFPNLKYNAFFYRIWLLAMNLLGQKTSINYFATKDAVLNNFSRTPEEVKLLLNDQKL